MGVCALDRLFGGVPVCLSATQPLTEHITHQKPGILSYGFPPLLLFFTFRFQHGTKQNPTAAGRSTLSTQGETF